MQKRNNSFKYDRISSEIKKELQTIITTEIKDPRIKSQVSITECIVSKDLSLCKVFIVTDQEDKDNVIKGLNNSRGFLRSALAHTLDLRKTPDFKFYIDESFENMNHIEELLNKIKQS